MAGYDVYRVFENLPTILGLELVRKGQHWEGGYYLNGGTHQFRRDKLKIAKWNNDIWLHEEGGESMSLVTWLQNYGGASDWKDALRILRGHKEPVRFDRVFRSAPKGLRVPEDAYIGARGWGLEPCPLFRWMCELFPEERVREAWEKFCVTTDTHGNVVWWYRDVNGRLCHDKIMRYKGNGHRDRESGAWRRYRVGDGYTDSCFFGAHLWGGEDMVAVVESEKTALLYWLYYGRPVMATGGKSMLREFDPRLLLVPDMDARAEWDSKGDVFRWWDEFSGVGEHDDIGDAIVRRILQNKK